jgi:NADPH-ferrihemoprotein reductase
MANLTDHSKVVARVNVNASFRLPLNPKSPMVMLAGGCGVAPIRAFLEERIMLMERGVDLGEAVLFVGYRNPADEVWSDMVKEALRTGTLTQAFVAFTTGVPDAAPITDVLRDQSKVTWDVLQADGYIYVCGGAQNFGAAVKSELIDILAKHGGHDEDSATAFLQDLAHCGRLCEDLAD